MASSLAALAIATVLTGSADDPCVAITKPGTLDDLTKIFVGAIVTVLAGAIGFHVSQVILYRRTRRTLLIALKEEAVTAKRAVVHMLTGVQETVPAAAAIVKSVEDGTLPFELLNKLYSGWIIYVPAYSMIETVAKLTRWDKKLSEKQIHVVIAYLDLWSVVSVVERSYSASHAKLVELSSKIDDDKERTRIRETASQVHECLSQLADKAQRLLDAAREVEKLQI
jgi:hypothetical protein